MTAFIFSSRRELLSRGKARSAGADKRLTLLDVNGQYISGQEVLLGLF